MQKYTYSQWNELIEWAYLGYEQNCTIYYNQKKWGYCEKSKWKFPSRDKIMFLIDRRTWQSITEETDLYLPEQNRIIGKDPGHSLL